MEKILLIIALIIIGFLFLKNIRKAILYTFGSNTPKLFGSNLTDNVENLMMHSFLQIREGMTLFLLYAFDNNLTKDEINNSFKNLISASIISDKDQYRHLEIIKVIRNNDRIVDFFVEAMRIKTMLLSKLGHVDEAIKIRMNLSEIGLSISEKSVNSEPMNPDEFFSESEIFLDECRKKYSDSLNQYKAYYQEEK